MDDFVSITQTSHHLSLGPVSAASYLMHILFLAHFFMI